MTIASLEGFARGLVDQPYSGSETGVPALRSFYFGFGIGGPAIDNKLQYLMLLPGGESKDVTPDADLSPSEVQPGTISLGFSDKDASSARDRYYYRASHTILEPRFARRFQVRDVGDVGTVTRALPREIFGSGPVTVGTRHILALAGFKMFFTGNRDHKIDQIIVQLEENGQLTVGFNDRNDDDVFAYLVDIVRIGGPGFDIETGQSAGRTKGGESVLLPHVPHADLVLTGFRFDFTSSDHKLREIGVVVANDRLTVFFADKNGDDQFDWEVRWAHVGPQLLSP